ncbi:uncharacterized protein [Atheta coriaria]|uniref:uncharacterized protein n=1 Tax=Dalotia coriaria TaxID=877792 RepID=UPI0031F3B8C2
MTGREFPKVYLKFEGRLLINGKKRQYWIQDATEDMFDELEDLSVNKFIGDEPTTRYMKMYDDPISLEEIRVIWRKFIDLKLTLVCLTKDDENKTKIVAFNVLYLSNADDKTNYDLRGETSQRLFRMFKWLENQRNFFEEFNIQCVMKSRGLYVLEDYRREALGERLLEAREYMCRHLGITATLTTFTSFVSQKLAARLGFQDFYSVEYEELGRIDPGMYILFLRIKM